MFKTNGRTKAAAHTNKTKASVLGKEFVCTSCGETKRVSDVEFGEAILCSCGKTMIEKK